MFALCSCRRWVQASRWEDLHSKSVDYLHANCKLCADHFDSNQFLNAVARSKLIWNAEPTVFTVPNLPKQLATPEGHHWNAKFCDFIRFSSKTNFLCPYSGVNALQTLGSFYFPSFPSLLFPFPPPLIQLGSLGGAISSPAGPGSGSATTCILVHFEVEVKHFVLLISCIFLIFVTGRTVRYFTGWPQTWKTWNTQGFLWTWKTQGILCSLRKMATKKVF